MEITNSAENRRVYGASENQYGQAVARANFSGLYDVHNRFFLDIGIHHFRSSEIEEGKGHVGELKAILGERPALYQEIQVLRFLGDTAAVGRYEGMLKFVCGKSDVSRAEVESFYRANLRAHIAELVSEEFNKVSFLLRGSPKGSYNAVLTRNPQDGQYNLSYEDANDVVNTLSAQTLNALLAAIEKHADFNQDCVRQVRAQANLIPAIAITQQALSDITDIIYNFYISPNQSRNYGSLRDVHALYRNLADHTGKLIFEEITRAYARTLYELNPALESKVSKDGWNNRNYVVLTAEQRQRLAAFR